MGGLHLNQTGNGVSGNAMSNGVATVEINCTQRGNECVGTATRFGKGGGPKRQKITFRIGNGGLDFTEGGTAGFCSRK
jgi:hypothetical protein